MLFDDGTNIPSNVLQQRTDIETCSRKITRKNNLEATKDSSIPIVMVLVEGGLESIKTVCQAVKSKTLVVVIKVLSKTTYEKSIYKSNFSILFLKDTGRAADYIAELHDFFSNSRDIHSTSPSGGSRELELEKM